MGSIGERIRVLRIRQHMTLAELGERANLSASHLSQIERDRTTPSLATLMAIARALDVGLRHFFETETEAAYVVRADEVEAVAPPGSTVVRTPLTPEVGNNKLSVYRVALGPHMAGEEFAPLAGEVLAFVLAGALTVTVGDERFVLQSGDSIHFDATHAWSWSNEGDEPCVVIWGRSAT